MTEYIFKYLKVSDENWESPEVATQYEFLKKLGWQGKPYQPEDLLLSKIHEALWGY